MFDTTGWHFGSTRGKYSRAGDENRTRMASLEGRDHCAGGRAPSRPRALMTDLGLPTLAVRNGPLMVRAWLPDVPKLRQRNKYVERRLTNQAEEFRST
jgi:hypothetical protein